jgi:hypothetical protein
MFNDPDLPHVRRDTDDAGFESSGTEEASAAPARFGRLAICVAAASALAFGVVGTVAYGVWFNSDQQTYAEAIARARQALRMPAPANAAPVLANALAGPIADSLTSPGNSSSPGAFVPPPSATLAAAPNPAPAISAAPVMTSALDTPPAKQRFSTNLQSDPPLLLNLPALPAQSVASTAQDDRKPSTWSGQVTRAPDSESVADDLSAATPSAPSSTLAAPPRAARRAANAAEPQLASARQAKEAKYAQQERRTAANSSRHKENLFARMGSFFRRVSYRQHGSGNQQDLYSHP